MNCAAILSASRTNTVDQTVTSAEEILEFQQLIRMVPIAEAVEEYVVNLVRGTRPTDATAPDFVKKYVNFGASVRAAQFIVLGAKVRALSRRRWPPRPPKFVRQRATVVLRKFCVELIGIDRWLCKFCGE